MECRRPDNAELKFHRASTRWQYQQDHSETQEYSTPSICTSLDSGESQLPYCKDTKQTTRNLSTPSLFFTMWISSLKTCLLIHRKKNALAELVTINWDPGDHLRLILEAQPFSSLSSKPASLNLGRDAVWKDIDSDFYTQIPCVCANLNPSEFHFVVTWI